MKLYHGDCIEVMDSLISDGVVIDCIIADIPYGSTACKWDSVIPFDAMWSRLNKLIKPNGVICLFGTEPFSSQLRVSNLDMYRYDWKWNKNQGSNFQLAKLQPLKVLEDIMVFSKGKSANGAKNVAIYYPQKVPREKPEIKGGGLKSSKLLHGNNMSKQYKLFVDRYPTNILSYPRVAHTIKQHPTQKPVALMEYLVKTYSLENELVLDFTMGVGTTGVACKNLNRHFIGIELEKQYYDLAYSNIFGKQEE